MMNLHPKPNAAKPQVRMDKTPEVAPSKTVLAGTAVFFRVDPRGRASRPFATVPLRRQPLDFDQLGPGRPRRAQNHCDAKMRHGPWRQNRRHGGKIISASERRSWGSLSGVLQLAGGSAPEPDMLRQSSRRQAAV
jgi:hypothetical protein